MPSLARLTALLMVLALAMGAASAHAQRSPRYIVIMEQAMATSASAAPVASVVRGLAGPDAAVRRLDTARPLVVVELDAAGRERLEADPRVAAVVEDYVVPPALFASVPAVGAINDALPALEDGDAWRVAVLDTGVDAEHPFFADRVAQEVCFSSSAENGSFTSLCPGGVEFFEGPGAAGDCETHITGCGHGTHVAGIVAGADGRLGNTLFSGVAPAAEIVAVKVFTKFHSEIDCGAEQTPCVLSFVSDQIEALEYLRERVDFLRLAAINMSLGSGRHSRACDADVIATEIDRLTEAGVPVVIAAGNDGHATAVARPGCVSAAFTVGATGRDDVVDATFSNRSTALIDLVAPGVRIYSAMARDAFHANFGGGDYIAKTGTSMAAPHVAGAIAALKGRFPDQDAVAIAQQLAATGVPVPDPRGGSFNRLDLLATAQALGALDPVAMASPENEADAPAGAVDEATRAAAAAGERLVIQALPVDGASRGNQLDEIARELLPADTTFGRAGADAITVERAAGLPPTVLEDLQRALGGDVRIQVDRKDAPLR